VKSHGRFPPLSPPTAFANFNVIDGRRRVRIRVMVVLGVAMILCLGTTVVVGAARSAPPPAYRLLVSTRPDRSAAIALDGAVVGGMIHVFLTPDAGVSQVDFHLDDTTRARRPARVEESAPFDLGGTMLGVPSRSLGYDTTQLPVGDHTVTAAVAMGDGGVVNVSALFRVRREAPTPASADPLATGTGTTVDTAGSPPARPASGRGGVAGAVTRGVLFGLGPEASDARDARLVREAPVGMLSSWYNGPGDLAWMPGWGDDVVPEAYAAGKALHLIVYSGDEEAPIETAHGPACGRAYPLSDRFPGDMERLARTFAGRPDGPSLYVTLFTEFQTYPCVDNEWAPDAATTAYYEALKDRYRETQAMFHRVAPNAKVSLGWGGWQARWDAPATGGGRSLVKHFDDVLRASDFHSFQAMASDTNVRDVRDMTRLLGAYGPVMLAHYKPDRRSPSTLDADLRTMLSDAYLDEVVRSGLFAFSFMDDSDLNPAEPTYELVRSVIQRRGIPL
jgi:hypothetical protein